MHLAGLGLTVPAVHSHFKNNRNPIMSDDEIHTGGDHNSGLDAFAAITLILIAVLTVVFWVSQH